MLSLVGTIEIMFNRPYETFKPLLTRPYLFLLPPLEALLLPPAFDFAAPPFFAPPFLAPPFFALLFFVPFDLAGEVEAAAPRVAARVAVRVVFSAALAERLATRLAALVCLRTSFVFSLAALLTASLTPRPEELALLVVPFEREERLGRITSAAAGLIMLTMLAADSITPLATFEA
jgi:hypothetical protein